MRHRGHQLTNTFLNALGDNDLAFAGQQFNRTHFPHVHANRVGSASGFVFNSGKSGSGFSGRDLVSRPVTFSQDQFVSIGGLLKDLNTHVVDHLNDIFDLIGFRNVLREVIVDFGVGEVALLLTLSN